MVTGRELLRQISLDTATIRGDLVGRQGISEGSGTSDLFLYQAGEWCLKTSGRRYFSSLDRGRDELLFLARKKVKLGTLRPPRTILVLQPEEEGEGCWLWTIMPWMQTLRGLMSRAVEEGNEGQLTAALEIYAWAAIRSLLGASRQGIMLDVHPSNFVLAEDQTSYFYIDDDIGSGNAIPAIGFALLRRVEEYSEWPVAIATYVEVLEQALSIWLKPRDVQVLDLTGAIQQTFIRSEKARLVREQLLQVVRRIG